MVIVDQGVLDGTDRSWRDHHGRYGVVPATAHMAVTVDARMRTGPHGQGRVAETQRLEPEGVGMTAQTIDDQ